MRVVLVTATAFLAAWRGDSIFLHHTAIDESSCVPPGMRAVQTVAGFKMVVLGDDDIVSKQFAAQGFWEIKEPQDMIPPQMQGTVSLPKKGTLLDIGANIGDYTLLFASKGYNVIAVEPMTRNRQALQASICLNPQFKDRITVVPAALVAPEEVAGRRCVIRSTNYQINIGNGFLSCGQEAEIKPCEAGDENCEEVPVKTLATALSEVNPKSVDVVKMDVENYECHVFAGGETLFTKYHPKLLQVETMWGHTGQCVHDMAKKFSYDAVKVGDNTEMVAKSRTLFF
jgi:FkbM family methyltransferase